MYPTVQADAASGLKEDESTGLNKLNVSINYKKMFLYRAFAKARKVRVPTGNPREAINVIIPPRITHPTETFTTVARSMHGRVITAFNEFTELNPADIVNDSKSKVTMKLPEGDFSVEYDVGR